MKKTSPPIQLPMCRVNQDSGHGKRYPDGNFCVASDTPIFVVAQLSI